MTLDFLRARPAKNETLVYGQEILESTVFTGYTQLLYAWAPAATPISGAVTLTDASSDLAYTADSLDDLEVDDRVVLQGTAVGLTTLDEHTAYFVVEVDAIGSTVALALTQGGTPIVANSSGAATVVKVEQLLIRSRDIQLNISNDNRLSVISQERIYPGKNNASQRLTYAAARTDALLATPLLPVTNGKKITTEDQDLDQLYADAGIPVAI